MSPDSLSRVQHGMAISALFKAQTPGPMRLNWIEVWEPFLEHTFPKTGVRFSGIML